MPNADINQLNKVGRFEMWTMPFFVLFVFISWPYKIDLLDWKNENQQHMSGLVEWNQQTYLEAFAINHIVLIEIGLSSLTSLLLAW